MKKKIILAILLCMGNLKAVNDRADELKIFASVVFLLPFCSVGAGYSWLSKLQPRKPYIIMDIQGITIIDKHNILWHEIKNHGDRVIYYYDTNGYQHSKKVIFIDYERDGHQDSITLEESDLPLKTTEFLALIKELSTKLPADVEKRQELAPAATNPLQDITEEDLKHIEKVGFYKNEDKNIIVVFTAKPSWLTHSLSCAGCYAVMAGCLYYLYCCLQSYSNGGSLIFS